MNPLKEEALIYALMSAAVSEKIKRGYLGFRGQLQRCLCVCFCIWSTAWFLCEADRVVLGALQLKTPSFNVDGYR